jgi:hypothetical protein
VQGNHGHQNFSFIGDQFDLSYTAEDLLTNKIVQNQVSIHPVAPPGQQIPSNIEN